MQLSVDGAGSVFDQSLFCVGVQAGVQQVNAAKPKSHIYATILKLEENDLEVHLYVVQKRL